MDASVRVWGIEAPDVKHAIKRSYEIIEEEETKFDTVFVSNPVYYTTQARSYTNIPVSIRSSTYNTYC